MLNYQRVPRALWFIPHKPPRHQVSASQVRRLGSAWAHASQKSTRGGGKRGALYLSMGQSITYTIVSHGKSLWMLMWIHLMDSWLADRGRCSVGVEQAPGICRSSISMMLFLCQNLTAFRMRPGDLFLPVKDWTGPTEVTGMTRESEIIAAHSSKIALPA